MKTTFVLLAGICLVASGAARADTLAANAVAPAKVRNTKAPRQVTYVTNVATTGSHIPLIVTRYGNKMHTNASCVTYRPPQLGQTGQLSVGSQLLQLDPAITFGGRR